MSEEKSVYQLLESSLVAMYAFAVLTMVSGLGLVSLQWTAKTVHPLNEMVTVGIDISVAIIAFSVIGFIAFGAFWCWFRYRLFRFEATRGGGVR